MKLDLLVKYAHDHGLETEPGFNPKMVKWAIVCDVNGRFLDVVVELGDGSRKKNPGREFPKCPDLSQPEMKAGGVTKSHFLVETAQVVSLYGKNADDSKNQKKHAYFVDLLRQAATAMPELALLADMLSDEDALQRIRERLEREKAKPIDKVTFRLDQSFPLESNDWHDWWRSFRKGLNPHMEIHHPMLSFISGELIEPVRTHDNKIKGLGDVGCNSNGGTLVSFDKESFCSYHLTQSANAAMSEEEAWAYCSALNHLIREYGQRLAGAKVVHWFKKKVLPEDDPLSFMEEPREVQELTAQRRAQELLKAIKEGKRADLCKNYYYALTLSGNGGRVVVRDWMEGQFEELVASICSWFEDLEITNLSASKTANAPGIERVITCLLPQQKPTQKYLDWVKPIGSQRLHLWHAALRGEPIPYTVLAPLVVLNAKFHVSGALEEAEKNKKINPIIRSLLYARMGLMKAYHIRKDRKKGGEVMIHDLKPYLNEEHPHPAYHCGRLMAVLARLQYKALGDVGAGVVQRYYAAASSTPGLVLGRLTRTGQFHLGKLDPGPAYWYEDKLAAIWGRIRDDVPGTLTLDEQSLFALGYYQQMADLRPKKSDDSNNRKEQTDE